jgi:FtsH-binding integral membrane protein
VYGRLYARQLIALGLPSPPDPLIWFTGLGVAAYATGALALRAVEARIAGAGDDRHLYAAACVVGALGLLLLARAPDALVGSAGVLLVGGVALVMTRTVGAIWINRRTASDVRATVQSLLAQAEYAGEILCGVALGALARRATIPVAFACAAALLVGVGVLVARTRPDPLRHA